MRMVRRVGVLLVLWLLAWGEISVANLASGVAAAGVLLLAFPPGPPAEGRMRLSAIGVVRLAAYVLSQLVVSNVVMTRRILSRRPGLAGGVVAHRLEEPSERIVTVMTSIIALSPGTMTVDVDQGSTTIYVHFLDLPDIDRARTSLDRLERLAVAAIAAGGPVPGPRTEP